MEVDFARLCRTAHGQAGGPSGGGAAEGEQRSKRTRAASRFSKRGAITLHCLVRSRRNSTRCSDCSPGTRRRRRWWKRIRSRDAVLNTAVWRGDAAPLPKQPAGVARNGDRQRRHRPPKPQAATGSKFLQPSAGGDHADDRDRPFGDVPLLLEPLIDRDEGIETMIRRAARQLAVTTAGPAHLLHRATLERIRTRCREPPRRGFVK